MNKRFFRLILLTLPAIICLPLIFPGSAAAQRRDYLTVEEIELVRDAQEIDKRIEILVKAIDRRFLVINNDNSQEKQVAKDADKWGQLPEGERVHLLSDIRYLLQKAIDDIDEVAAKQGRNRQLLERGETTEEDKVTAQTIRNNDRKFPQAIHFLADAARRYMPRLQAIRNESTDSREQGAITKALEFCDMIIEASGQVPRPQKK